MSIYYKYEPDGSKLVVFSYVYYCLYWYTYEKLGKWFVDTIENIFHVNFLGYAHWFMYIKKPIPKDNSILLYQAIYATFVVVKYLDTSTIKQYSKLCKTTLPHDMILYSLNNMLLPVTNN